MSEHAESSFLESLGRGIRMLGIIAILAVALMGLILGVAKLFDTSPRPMQTPQAATQSAAAREAQATAKHAQPAKPYAPEPWPTYPGRRPKGAVPGGGDTVSGTASEPPPPSVPVGISAEDYQAAVASGKKLFLPNPKGECTVSGPTATGAQALVGCFAPQAAR